MAQGALGAAGVRRVGYDWRWAAACVQRAGRGHIVSPRAQLVIYIGNIYSQSNRGSVANALNLSSLPAAPT